MRVTRSVIWVVVVVCAAGCGSGGSASTRSLDQGSADSRAAEVDEATGSRQQVEAGLRFVGETAARRLGLALGSLDGAFTDCGPSSVRYTVEAQFPHAAAQGTAAAVRQSDVMAAALRQAGYQDRSQVGGGGSIWVRGDITVTIGDPVPAGLAFRRTLNLAGACLTGESDLISRPHEAYRDLVAELAPIVAAHRGR